MPSTNSSCNLFSLSMLRWARTLNSGFSICYRRTPTLLKALALKLLMGQNTRVVSTASSFFETGKIKTLPPLLCMPVSCGPCRRDLIGKNWKYKTQRTPLVSIKLWWIGWGVEGSGPAISCLHFDKDSFRGCSAWQDPQGRQGNNWIS